MGTEITTIKHTGPDDQDLTGYIQLSMGDARLLVEAIEGWLYGFEMQEDDK